MTFLFLFLCMFLQDLFLAVDLSCGKLGITDILGSLMSNEHAGTQWYTYIRPSHYATGPLYVIRLLFLCPVYYKCNKMYIWYWLSFDYSKKNHFRFPATACFSLENFILNFTLPCGLRLFLDVFKLSSLILQQWAHLCVMKAGRWSLTHSSVCVCLRTGQWHMPRPGVCVIYMELVCL